MAPSLRAAVAWAESPREGVAPPARKCSLWPLMDLVL